MVPSAEDPRWVPVRQALGRLARVGARRYWIRQDGKELLGLRCVEDAAEALRAEHPGLLKDPNSDGRAEAVIQILKECIEPERNMPDGRLLWIVLDLDGKAPGASAKDRRTTAGQKFRGEDARPVGESAIRQHHEPRALDWLTDALLAYEDAHIARHDG